MTRAAYQLSVEQTLKQWDTSTEGLSSAQANQRLKEHGPNSLVIRGEPLWRKLFEPFASAFMWVLLAAGGLSLFTDEHLDAAIVFIVLAASAGIYYVQRFSTERILRALQQREKQAVSVLRAGTSLDVSIDRLVPGEVVLLHEGEKIPADLRLIAAENVRVDESLLTGESSPVHKHIRPLPTDKEIFGQANMLFQGTYLVSGQAHGVVVATGNDTAYGHLASLVTTKQTVSPIQRKIDRLMSQIILAILAAASLAFVLALLRGIPLTEALRFIMALAVSAVPEGLPVAISVILVLGMRRMARRRTLVRTLQAMENIGVITTVATDKTGTLTKNQLGVADSWVSPANTPTELLSTVQLATNHQKGKRHDPLDQAFFEYTQHQPGPTTKLTLETQLPFSLTAALSGAIWRLPNKKLVLAVKGAPERILQRAQLSPAQRRAAEHALHSFTRQGYKVIGVAQATISKSLASIEQAPATGFDFRGFIAIADELRPSAKQAIAAAQAAGISVRMITGDHQETAYHIGKRLGIANHESEVFDSSRLIKESDHQLLTIINRSRVFSRVVPENKFRILELLKKRQVTAMTGDGVNDVPALSNAHIGIAMGSGTQMAKEASDIILLNNDFKNVIEAVHQGRIIFSNIRKMLLYLFATSSGEVLTMLFALVLNIPLPIMAVQILWINLVTDTILVIPLGLEPGEPHIMKQPPRAPDAPILDRYLISRMALIATTMAATALTTFYIFHNNYPLVYAQTVTFSLLVVMQWANAFNARAERQSIFQIRARNYMFLAALGLAIGLQLLVVFGPLRNLLHVAPVAVSHLLITAAVGILAILAVSELHKLAGRRVTQITTKTSP